MKATFLPNKPLVLTVLTTTEEQSLRSVRQHIGEPLGSLRRAAGYELRRAKLGPRNEAMIGNQRNAVILRHRSQLWTNLATTRKVIIGDKQ